MSKTDKKERIASALEILVTQTDRDHINAVNGRNESSELFRSWMDFSIRMTKVAEDRLTLVQEVQSLKEAARKHFERSTRPRKLSVWPSSAWRKPTKRLMMARRPGSKRGRIGRSKGPTLLLPKTTLSPPKLRPRPSRLRPRRTWKRSGSNSPRPRLN
ncbi:uncharacterized protein LOC130591730 [Beta vulgaris subsp. vulgaris]|uniref:uncharacterized protein LOC130591730 n=1 Tax=Beta vulgaris subsp. vulgaris TaxID=3555 RepID=UPI0025490AA9|nr:uncharacterized protein LOC130591730 [Beta vulgaris subsp. vulgaris]